MKTKLTAKAQITGKVVHVNPINEFGNNEKKGKLISGLIQTYEESTKEGGKKFNYFSIEFIAYNEVCERMKYTQVNDIISIEGDLRTNFYNKPATAQIKVDKAEVIGRADEEMPKPKKEVKEPVFTVLEEDLPF
jgi:hypothetical protein